MEEHIQAPRDTGARFIGTTAEAAIDLTKSYDYQKLVEEEVREYDNIEVTEHLREGGVHAHKAWDYWFRYLCDRVWQTHFCNEIVIHCNQVDRPRILSLGCGYGGVELSTAKQLRTPYEFIAVDINPHLFEEAGRRAALEGLNITWEAADMNFIRLQENVFDVIYAHASLHHVLNLEHVCEQVYKGLKRDGCLVVADIIGKTRVLFWQENVEVAAEIVREMPDRYKARISDFDGLIRSYGEPGVQVGMEGIRQEEIPRQLSKWFSPIKMFTYGSFMRLICTNPVIGKMLDPDREEDRRYLEDLFELDLKLVREGKLRPTELFGVFRKKPQSRAGQGTSGGGEWDQVSLERGLQGSGRRSVPGGWLWADDEG